VLRILAAGDVSDFDAPRLGALRSALAAAASLPIDAVAITVAGASVQLRVVLSHGSQAGAAATLTTLESQMDTGPAATTLLSITVLAPPTLSIVVEQTVQLAPPPASPPPLPPPSPPSPPHAPPPSIPAPPGQDAAAYYVLFVGASLSLCLIFGAFCAIFARLSRPDAAHGLQPSTIARRDPAMPHRNLASSLKATVASKGNRIGLAGGSGAGAGYRRVQKL
jgi:hypothetical protein